MLPRSAANGPGLRYVAWFQGCSLACPGCANPETHAASRRQERSASELVEEILDVPGIQGVTFSGGEPFQQPQALQYIVERVRNESSLSILIFTGYSFVELSRGPFARILACVDVLIAGRYVQGLHRAERLLGSSNQRILRLSSRYSRSELAEVPEIEWQLQPNGDVWMTGIAALSNSDPTKA